MQRLLATATLAGLLGVLMTASDAQAFGHKKKAACVPVAYVAPCPTPASCPPPPQPVAYSAPCPPPPQPVACPAPCPPPKKKCGLFGGGRGGLFGHKKKAATVVTYPAATCAPVAYAAPAPACGTCGS